ncbi:hypothetical protein [Kibdelosporangium aridum]|uniref:hypothetical protein n=1 Tax=Kibdelosporangium aridum TaxID=2030 RepID=UPI000F793AE4|nr:hypothetical protein [Kibdelosporangium aridum]
MKLLTALVTAGLGLATVVAPSAAAAPTQCQYVARDLPIPSGADRASAVASSSDDRLVLGSYSAQGNQHAVLWRNGAIHQVLPSPPNTIVSPTGVNKHGVVVGQVAGNGLRAYRQLLGRFFTLYTTPGHHSYATAINDNGDIAGGLMSVSDPAQLTAVVWERDKPGLTVVGSGQAVLITNDRKVLTDNGTLFDLATGTSVNLNASSPFVLDNERIFGWGHESIPEWDTRGQRVANYDLGVEPLGVNSHNTLFGGYGPNPVIPGLWRGGVWTPIQADKLPLTYGYGDVTDDEVLVGNHEGIRGLMTAAQWFCAP